MVPPAQMYTSVVHFLHREGCVGHAYYLYSVTFTFIGAEVVATEKSLEPQEMEGTFTPQCSLTS